MIARINQEKRLMYYFTTLNGLQTAICMQPEWVVYIHKNQEILTGWLQYNMIKYLQRRNPSVPGIADKLEPPRERKLDSVQKYWRVLIGLGPVREIYGNEMMHTHEAVRDAFENCAKEHLNSSEIRGRIYKKGLSLTEFSNVLEEVVQPVYQSAKNCGFRNWVYTEETNNT